MKNDSKMSFSYKFYNFSALFYVYIARSDVNLTYEEARVRSPQRSGIVWGPFYFLPGENPGGGPPGSLFISSAGEYSVVILAPAGSVSLDMQIDLTDPSYNEMYRALLLINLCFLVLYSKHFWSISDWLTRKRLALGRRKWLELNGKEMAGDALSVTVIVLAFLFSWMLALAAATLILFFRLLAPYSRGTDPVYELHLNRDLDNQNLSS